MSNCKEIIDIRLSSTKRANILQQTFLTIKTVLKIFVKSKCGQLCGKNSAEQESFYFLRFSVCILIRGFEVSFKIKTVEIMTKSTATKLNQTLV
jgi:hypothetical protein